MSASSLSISAVFDVHARRCKILLLLTMSLYRFFTKVGMPSRVPSLSDKEIENANTSTVTYVRVY